MVLQMKTQPQPFFTFSISKTMLSFSITAFLCFTLCAGNVTTRCAETDKQALLKLKDGFIGQSDVLSSWNDEVDCCEWEGISCNNQTGHVTELNLPFSGLGGKIDSSLCELQHLTYLDLSDNYDLEAQKILKCIGSLSQLRALKLHYLSLVGTIPRELGNLSNLQTLDLSSNENLFVNDLEWISHLSDLRYLDLSQINLSQAVDWSSSISKISSVSKLSFRDCSLRHVNSDTSSAMNTSTSLQFLDLSFNKLNSSIMPWLLNVSKVLTELLLSSNSFQGHIPNEFGTMTSLEYLFLSDNNFEGGIPKSFRNLCQLKGLYLSSNRLSGKLSDSVKQLCHAQSSLEGLDLSDNPFSLDAFPDLTKFSRLTSLHLRKTSLCGLLPQSLGHFPSLESLDLSNNQLNGTLPYSIGQLSTLISLELDSNNFSGVINEAHLRNLSLLLDLDVSHNLISFNLSSNWVPPFQMEKLRLSSCRLGPAFPQWLKSLWPSKFLDISYNGISHSIPTWFWDLSPCLPRMNISHNNIVGPLPNSSQKKKLNCSLPPMWGLFIWDLSFNNFSGPLPQFPTESDILQLSNNMLSGSVSHLCATPKLLYLDLSNNLLSGKLPDCLGYLQNLRVLNLAKNNLSGRIPEAMGALQSIVSIHLNDNNLSGEIPTLTHCRYLKSIDFGENNLQGELPSWIGYNLTDLIVLRLKTNRFQGSIPASLCNLSYLQILDLSHNSITGQIPQCFNNIHALSNIQSSWKAISYVAPYYEGAGQDLTVFFDKASLVWKGADREYERNLGLMATIDLSCNYLEGEIPRTITKLLALTSLNLSRNNLTGFIPNNIGEMKVLESLDLSRNHFSGIIPASFSKLSFLSFLDLSFNNLSGQIPLTTQLQTFNASSYMGNQGLCGPPLPEKCPTPPPTSSTQMNDSEGDDTLINFGFYVSIALGFITGFWVVCGTLVTKSSWRKAYFQFASNTWDWIYVHVVLFIRRMKRKFQN